MSMNPQLQEAYRLIREGNKPEAMRLLLPIVKADANNADAWWLLANAVPDPVQARRALEQVLRLRPTDDKARKMLDKLGSGGIPAAMPPVSAPPRQSFGTTSSTDPFGSSDPFGSTGTGGGNLRQSSPPANDPFGSSPDPFGAPAPIRNQPAPSFGSQPASGFGSQPGFGNYPPPAPPKKSGGCRGVLIGCGVISLLCVVACAASILLAGSQIRGVIDQVGTQNPAAGDAVNGIFGALLQGNTPDPAILNTLQASGINITIDPALGNQINNMAGTALAGGQPNINAANTVVASGLAGNNPFAGLMGAATQIAGGDTTALNSAMGGALATAAAGGAPDLSGLLGGMLSGVPGSPIPAQVSQRGSLSYGAARTETLAAADRPDAWTLTGNRGDRVNVTVNATGNAWDPVAALYGSTPAVLLAFNDDTNGLNPVLEFVLPESATYTLVISIFGGTGTGEYTVTVQQQ